MRTRTLENYTPRVPREQENLANGEKSDGSDDESKTPRAGDKMDVDDPGSQGGRATRGEICMRKDVRLHLLICTKDSVKHLHSEYSSDNKQN